MTNKSALLTLSQVQCSNLLTKTAFGRLAFNDELGPVVLPVNYIFVESTVVIRTAPGSKLSLSPMTNVALEIDGVNADHTSGWSVLVRGIAFDVTTAIDELSETVRSIPFLPWVPGEKEHVLRISAKSLTGRYFGEPPALGE